ncbi:YopX family protein [Enterococcus faecalis]|uniref:YopX family protein n=1 Tax=Enterococcus faecalis TaxID=1351 RepID=UPI0022E24332|nr:YopX family protein [Enterococcus faecalis]
MIPKFRAFIKKENKIRNVTTIDFTLKIIECLNGVLEYEFEYVVLMQSTGLRDKNGVEIFEGDVLYYIPFESHINDSIVVFEKGSFCKKMLRNGKLTSVRFIDSEEYEVIGNVYENPELLEVAE